MGRCAGEPGLRAGCVALAFAFLADSIMALSMDVTPIQKVIDMLQEMNSKGAAAMQLEKKIFKEYSTWAAGQKKEYEEEIATAKDMIEELTAFVEKANNDISNYGAKIKSIDSQTSETESTQAKSKSEREDQHAKFLADQTDYTESLYALDQAIQTLKAQSYDRAQALLQLQDMARSKMSMRRVLGMLQMAQEEQSRAEQSGAPAVAAYEFQSSEIVDMLEDLKKKISADLDDLQKSEMNEDHAFQMEAVNLEHIFGNLKAERQELSELKAKTTTESAEARGKLAATKATLAETSALLSETKSTLAIKTAAFESNQQVRKEEIVAIDKALEILKSSEASGAYAEHVNAQLVQKQPVHQLRKVALLQLHSHSRRVASRDRAAEFLSHRAKALKSKALATLASQITANPFEKVITMIKDLLEKLKDEAISEADHKAFCDEELAKNAAERKKHTSKAATLQAEIQLLQSKIAEMAEEIATLSKEQAELKENMAKATATRTEEKEANTKAIADSIEAQDAIKKAISVLKTFFASQGTSLVQSGSVGKQVPEMEAYKGMQSSEGGVIGMLEVIESDFARLEADTKASEAQAASEHDKYITDATKSAKDKHDAEFQLSLDKDQTEFLEEQAQKDLGRTNEQLSAATDYFEELKPQCVEVNVSYEERAQRREEEIAALKQAYEILDQKAR
mmetsp:Transcript_124715/g.233208  ORF Transcript_124715/g.233208 Transcript_124715/m.233208 type:complete len:683 (+) Transcript_124715:76-2124(+)